MFWPIRHKTIAMIIVAMVSHSAQAQVGYDQFDQPHTETNVIKLGEENSYQAYSSVHASNCLDFAEVLQLAEKNDPNVTISQADLFSAQAGLVEARSLTKPQVSVFAKTGLGDEGLINSNISNQLGVRASQRIYDFGDSRLAREAAEVGVSAQEDLVLSAKSQSKLAAGLEYINWLDASERLEATVDRVDYFSQEYKALDKALVTGGATRGELAELGAELAGAEADRFTLESDRSRAATRLALLINSERPICQNSENAIRGAINVIGGDIGAQAVDVTAASDNPEIQALQKQARRLRVEAERSKRSRYPIINLVGIGSLTADRDFDNSETRERIGIDVSVPVFTGSALSAKADRARADAMRAQGRLDRRRRELQEQIKTAYKRSLLLNEQLGRRKAVIEFRQTEFEMAQNAYGSGLKTLPEIVDTRLRLEEARLLEVRTRYDYLRQLVTLKSLSGDL